MSYTENVSSEGGKKRKEGKAEKKEGKERSQGRRKNKIIQDKLIVPDLVYDIVIMRNSVL